MASNNNSLYGNPRRKQSQNTTPQSSSSLAFTSHLSSLISQHQPSSTTGRARPSKSSKSDIFSVSNRGAQKRAAADLLDDNNGQQHKTEKDIGKVDEATLHRSKRRMEEKVRLYEDLKNGSYLAGDSDDEDEAGAEGGGDAYLARLRRKEKEGLVDFDRKWADEERKREDNEDSQEEKEEEDDDNASIISYEDDLGRTRHGTRAEAARAAAESQSQHEAAERWRPQRPTNLIYGETIQTQAFNPDANTAEQMSYLAARRDRSPTPPEETHYDPEGEVRNRGTGFYAFSKDENIRKQQMEELMGAREETVKERDARRERRAERKRVKDERRRKIEELRVKRRAEVFLAGLGDLGVQS